jgi:hypothetical protein
VTAGTDATITVQTATGASCSIAVRYRSGISTAKGLEPITAGTWEIRVTAGGAEATWPFDVR